MCIKIESGVIVAFILVATAIVCAQSITLSAIQMTKLNGQRTACVNQYDLAQCAEDNQPCLVAQVVRLVQVGIFLPVPFCQMSADPVIGMVTGNGTSRLSSTLKTTFRNEFESNRYFSLNII